MGRSLTVRSKAARGALVLVGVAACEAVVGADFDKKHLDPATTGTGAAGGGGSGGATGGAGQGGDGGMLLPNGAPCADAGECASMLCVDDVCCDAGCGGECRRCDLAGSEGACTPLPEGSDCPDGDGVCDGAAFCAGGATRFARIFGDGANQSAEACGFRPDGQLWVAGNYGGALDLGGTPLTTATVSRRIFLARFDASGALAFQTAIGDDNPLSTDFELHDMAVGADGSAALVGRIDGVLSYCSDDVMSAGNDTAFVMKVSATGDCQWIRRYEAEELCNPGLGTCPAPMRVAVAPSGEVAVAGTFYGWVDYGAGVENANTTAEAIFVARHAADGALVEGLVNGSDGAGAVTLGVGFSGAAVAVGGMFVGGSISFGAGPITANGGLDVFAATAGSAGWARGFGDGFTSYCDSMSTDSSGNVLLSASFQSELNFGGGTILNSNDNPGLELDLGLGKLRPDGSAAWPAVGFGPFDTLVGQPMHAVIGSDAVGNVIVAGRLRGEDVVFGGHSVPQADESNFLVKLSGGSTVLWARAFGILDPPAAEVWPFRVLDVAGGASGEVALCGFSANQIDLGTGPLTPAGGRDLVVGVFEP